jgi:hypothetical protein
MNTNQTTTADSTKKIPVILGLVGGIIGAWSLSAFISGFAAAGWQPTEFFRSYLVALGMIKEFETLVDFYTHIKGVEYLICVAFLSTFPVFFKILEKPAVKVKA